MHYFFQIFFWADYTSKYCLLSIQLTSACIYTPQHTNFGCFVCVSGLGSSTVLVLGTCT